MSHPHGNDRGGYGGGDQAGWGGQNPQGQNPQGHAGWSGGQDGRGGGQDGGNFGYGQDAGGSGFGNQSYGASAANGGGPHGSGGPGGPGGQYGPGSPGGPYGSGGPGGPGGQYGPGSPGGPGGPYGPGAPEKPKTGLIIGIVGGVVALLVVIAIAVAMLVGGSDDNGGGGGIFGPSEEEQRQDAADGVNETMTSLGDFVSLVQWNTAVCEEYQGSEESLRAADGFLSFLGGYDALFDFSLDDFNVTADQVEFTNEERTEINVHEQNSQGEDDAVAFRYEEETWKICDPDLDLRQFEDIDTLGF